MALVLKDRVQETSTTVGTGTLTLAGAVSGFQTFSAVIGNANTTYYAIVEGSNWEVGLGTVGAGTLARTTVYGSSNAGSLVSFTSASKNVFCTYVAGKAIIQDASGNVTIPQAARGTVTTDNDLSFDMNVSSNFKSTPTATGSLTFTNITSGQSGYVLLVNTGGYAISAAATTKVNSSFLATVSTAGTYLLSYFTDGTNVYVTTGGIMA